MVMTETVRTIFDDARALQAAAVERLDQGDIRDAAEKAWGATKRATDALVLARTGDRPEFPAETAAGLRQLWNQDEAVRQAGLRPRYYTRQGLLHGHCFYMGLCDPLEDTESLIRETSGYIEDTERLAEGETP